MSKKPAAAVEASPPLWPWMLIAALVILIAFLLRLGAAGDDGGSHDRLGADNGMTVNGALETGGPSGRQDANAAWPHASSFPASAGGQAAYAGAAGGAGTASQGGGVSGWFSRFFGSDSASPTPGSTPGSTAAAISGGAGGYAQTTGTRLATTNTNTSAAAATAARTTPMRELPNEQRMQPGDDSAYLKDGAPGETAGDNSPD